MKLACFGDLHAHDFSEFSEIDNKTGNSRLTTILDSVYQMANYCNDNDIEYILFSGDLFHKRKAVSTSVFNHTFNVIKDIAENQNIKFILLVGNHDQEDNSESPQHSLEAFKEIEGVIVLDEYKPLNLSDDVVIYPLPFTKSVDKVKTVMDEYEKQINEQLPKVNILLFHLGISGAFVGNTSYQMQDSFSLNDLKPHLFSFGIGGHYHHGQMLSLEHNFFYTGSLIQHNFGDETNINGFFVIDTETNKVEVEEVKAPKFITITDSDLDTFDKDLLKDNFVRFKVSSNKVNEINNNLEDKQEHYKIEPQIEMKEEKRLDIEHTMTNEQILRNYCDEFNEDAFEILLDILKEVETS